MSKNFSANLKYHEQSLSFDQEILKDSIVITDLITKEKNEFYLTENEKNITIKEASQISKKISKNVEKLNGFKQWQNGIESKLKNLGLWVLKKFSHKTLTIFLWHIAMKKCKNWNRLHQIYHPEMNF